MSDRIKANAYAAQQTNWHDPHEMARQAASVAPKREMAIGLSLDHWHVITQLLLAAPYVRAKDIIMSIEAQAKALDANDAMARTNDVHDLQHLRQQNVVQERDLQNLRSELQRIERILEQQRKDNASLRVKAATTKPKQKPRGRPRKTPQPVTEASAP